LIFQLAFYSSFKLSNDDNKPKKAFSCEKSMDHTKNQRRSLKGKSKSQVAREFNLPYKQVWRCTRNIPSKRGIPQELREKIHQEVLSGKSKRRVSIELGVSEKTAQYYTGDLWLTPFRKIQTPDRTLE
jgi:hypothetical protein